MRATKKTKWKNGKDYKDDVQRYLRKLARAQIEDRDEGFQMGVDKFRKKWNIITGSNDWLDDTEDWVNFLPKKILGVRRNLRTKDEQTVLVHGKISHKIRWQITSVVNLFLDHKLTDMPLGNFGVDMLAFMQTNGVDEVLVTPFFYYLFRDNLDRAPFTSEIIKVSEWVSRGGKRQKIGHKIVLEVGPNVREKDLMNIYSTVIAPIQRRLPCKCTKIPRDR